MRARRFTGPTLLDAVRRAREGLGDDALVRAARCIPPRWFRRSRATVFEVVAVEGRAKALHRDDALARSLAEELRALRVAIECLAERIPPLAPVPAEEPGLPFRPRVARGGAVSPNPTPRSVDAWNRN